MDDLIHVCERCMRPSLLVMRGDLLTYLDRCERCVSKETLAEPGVSTDLKHKSYPLLFRRTDLSRLPERLAQIAREWTPNTSEERFNLLLHGSSGKGKTRAAWYAANRIWEASVKSNKAHSLTAHTMLSLTESIMSSFKEGTKVTHDKLMDGLIRCDLLFIDDLGKERMTPRVAADLFAIVDERSMRLKPVIITSNFNGEGIKARFDDPEMGAAFVRRLRDFYLTISA